jgi:bifunctional non-homologous end joining protein LigD
MPEDPTQNDRLVAYRAKRSADRTPEPFGGERQGAGGIFVIQKHGATRLHYDVRLEYDGVLLSWAVPQGPSLDPSVKRFAARTEDHPLEYADFEGVIPAGEYGAGPMIVWDRGSLTWDEEPGAGLAKGKLLFTLSGHKVSGQWTLVEMKKAPGDWLLIKKADGWHSSAPEDPDGRSVYTGRTLEDLTSDDQPGATVHRIAANHGVEGQVPGAGLVPMLATVADEPFSRRGWLFELKYDGYRLLAEKDRRRVILRYRSGTDATAVFPEISEALRRLPYDHLLLDGEVVVLDDAGHPSFAGLQRRARLTNRFDVARAVTRTPATYFAFDLVSCDGLDLRTVPLRLRKEALATVVPNIGPLRYTDHIERRGEAMHEQVVSMGLEGVVAKDASSSYVSGRSSSWRKIRADHTDTFAVVGYAPEKGSQTALGSLLCAAYRDDDLSYVGRVGSGLSGSDLTDLSAILEAHRTDVPACLLPAGQGGVAVTPTIAVVVRYKEVTRDGHLRQPVAVSWGAIDVDAIAHLDSDGDPVHEPPEPVVDDDRSVVVTNPDKVLWPDRGFTKSDLIDYYDAVADCLLPLIAGRPLVLDRYPDGIEGKSFFQKNAPDFVPEWIRTEWIERDDGTGNNYFIVEQAETLRYLANLASIPLHVWASRVGSLTSPDWCILDLDPKGAPFSSVVTIARAIRELCDEMGLPSYPKTSGRTGLHVLIPMGPPLGYDHQKLLGALVAQVVESRHPEIATTVRTPARRAGKVYIDHLQNGMGKLIVAPYSVRPVPLATVSTPLRWSEVTPSLDIDAYTIRSVPRRLRSLASEPLHPILSDTSDIVAGLERLSKRLQG